MWVRKTAITKPKKKKRFWFYISMYLMILFALIHGDFYGVKGGRSRGWMALSKEEALANMPRNAVAGLVFVFLIYLFVRKVEGDQEKERLRKFICDKCNKIVLDCKNENCDCGGKFVNIQFMQWVDEK